MGRISIPKHKVVLENWFLAHYESSKQGRFVVRPPDVVNFLGVLWPVGLEYYSPLNPVFMSECLSLRLMNKHPIWLARDGLVPLLWFFRMVPSPKTFKSALLVHKDLAPFVPKAWRNAVGSYEIVMLERPVAKPKRLLLMGLVMETFCSMRHLEKTMDRLVERYGRDELKKMKVSAFLPVRHDLVSGGQRHAFHGKFMLEVAKRLGCEIEMLDWEQVERTDSFEYTEVIDLNEGLLCRDNYMVHLALSRGAALPECATVANAESNKFVQLSRYHGMRIQESLPGTCVLESSGDWKESALYLEKVRQALDSEANKRYPWPSWFFELGKAAKNQNEY